MLSIIGFLMFIFGSLVATGAEFAGSFKTRRRALPAGLFLGPIS